MANAETQPTNEHEGTNLANGEFNNTNAMEEDNGNDYINSEFVIESIVINPKAFIFQQITLSPTAAAMRKLTQVEGQAAHHIWKVFKYGIAICAEAARISSSTKSSNRVLQICYFDE